ncbi:multiple inositol polyphosphate phosphatase 1 [Prorops nasuta]|uniref:multiple inositol polyphosphate phosphatase 1 n=1 Tax=Prorops nasuta TaxID=863751 RepID=UPI0034CD1B35
MYIRAHYSYTYIRYTTIICITQMYPTIRVIEQCCFMFFSVILQLLILAICINYSISDSLLTNCFEDIDNYKCRLSTKTPYRFLANHNDTSLKYKDCLEKKIWLIVRHGTRYPGKKYVPRLNKQLSNIQEAVIQNYNEGTINLTKDIINEFKNWSFDITIEDIMLLHTEGKNEMIDLAERFQSRFPSIMPEIYDNQTYRFKYTATQRTEESAKHFTAGLFGWKQSKKVQYSEPEDNDQVLRFYKRCHKWKVEIKENPSANMEKHKFISSTIVADTIKNISNRINYEINYEIAHLIYTMCGFETAWYTNKVSPWCQILSLNDMKVLEFAEDLEYYWIDGYGFPLTYKQACSAMLNMFKFFESKDKGKVVAYFTHSGTILKLLALLGVAKDSNPLKHNSYLIHEETRSWKTTYIDAFATNIAFILYNCMYNGPSILVMHQERVVNLPGCPYNKPCPLSTMKALYPDHDEECLFESMCSLN